MPSDNSTPDSQVLSRQLGWGLLVGVVALGTILRFINLDSGLWFDEIRTLVDSVRRPLADIVTHFPSNNDHLLLSVLARISIVIFGEQAWSMRLPAVVFGIACLPMVYVLGATLGSRLQGLLAAIVMCVSYHHIWFSQNARGYTALLFATMLATYFLIRGLERRERSSFVGYGIAAAVGAYAHLTMVLVVIAQATVVAVRLLVQDRGIRLRSWGQPALGFVLSGLLTLLFYSPVLLEVEAFFTQEPQPKSARVATAGWAFWAMLEGLQVGFAMGWAHSGRCLALRLGMPELPAPKPNGFRTLCLSGTLHPGRGDCARAADIPAVLLLSHGLCAADRDSRCSGHRRMAGSAAPAVSPHRSLQHPRSDRLHRCADDPVSGLPALRVPVSQAGLCPGSKLRRGPTAGERPRRGRRHRS